MHVSIYKTGKQVLAAKTRDFFNLTDMAVFNGYPAMKNATLVQVYDIAGDGHTQNSLETDR